MELKDKKIKHFILVRVALKWCYLKEYDSFSEYCRISLELYDKYLRKSLANQTNQNFILVSAIDSSIDSLGNKLDNEVLLPVDKMNLIEAFNNKFKDTISDDEYYLITRIDRDDIVKKDFVEKLQRCASELASRTYIDIRDCYSYDGNILCKTSKYNNMVSHFVTVYEKKDYNGNIKCYAYATDHSKIGRILNGVKLKGLSAVQIIHDNNIINKMEGEDVQVDKGEFLKDYGINIE